MKHLILITLLLVGCKAAQDSTQATVAPEPGNPLPPANGSAPVTDPTPTEPPPEEPLQDHSSRSPVYATNATLAECQMLAEWHRGIDQTWYFGTYYEDYLGMTAASAIWWNTQEFYRVDRDGIVWREWAGDRWRNNYLVDHIAYLGPHCKIEITNSMSETINRVWWDNQQLN
jgi:hypothetical protein